MKSKYKITTVFLVIISMSFFSFQFAAADGEDYDIDIEEDSYIIWECTDHNVDLFNELKANYDYVAYHDFELDEGDKMKYEIDTITEYDDDDEYDIEIHYDDNYDEDDEDDESIYQTSDYGTYDSFYVAMDPVKLAADWTDGEGYEYVLTFICSDTEDYLADFYNNILPLDKSNFIVYGSTLTINQTVATGSYRGILTYDDDGILEEYSIIYNDVLIYKMELDDVISGQLQETDTFIIIVIISIILLIVGIIIVVVVVILVSAKKKKSKTGIILPTPVVPGSKDSQIPKTKISEKPTPPKTQADDVIVERFCELCGSKLDRDAKFCFSCGNKTD